MKRFLVLGASVIAGAFVVGHAESARACGGCFHPPPPPTQSVSDITDERMMLAVSPQQTTLYDQIRYSGTPSSFAWVLPIKGTVDVGLSADVMFDTIDAYTTTTIQAPQQDCPPPPNCGSVGFNAAAPSADGADNGGVTVTKQENVGPYATVQLHTTDPHSLDKWLADNGFEIPSDVTPIIDQYVSEGFDFLAMKLLPNQGVQSMRPVRVTFPGAALSLPLRMAAIGTGATVGITIWVVSDGRYEPQNFPSFHIDDAQLVWNYDTSQSNYTTLRAQLESGFNGSGWEIESSIDVNKSSIQSTLLYGGSSYGGPSGASSADDDYLPEYASDAGAPSDAGALADAGDASFDDAGQPLAKSAAQVRDEDIAALFAGSNGPNVRITRMRSDIAHAAMTKDFIVQASSDQAQLSNVRLVTKTTGAAPACPSYSSCGGIFGGCDASSQPAGGTGLLAGVLGALGIVAVRSARKGRKNGKSG
ncbi:MAG TPA: DUF2330 domain-containing protein [Polyangiaceae bacterium]